MWKTTVTGEAVNLINAIALDISDCDGKSQVWVISRYDRLLAEFDTREDAEEFIENLVAQLNAPMNFPAQMQAMTKNFLDKIAKDKLLFNVSDFKKGE